MKPTLKYCISLSIILMTITTNAKEIRVYFGTYTRKNSEGIYYGTLNLKNGHLKLSGLAAKAAHPSFLAVHPSGSHLYAVNEIGQGEITAFAFNPDGTLKFLNKQSTHGGAPCHLSIDKTGSLVLAANYSAGNVAAYRIQRGGLLSEATTVDQHEGSSVNPKRQQGPHAHSIDIAPDNRYAFSADLGIDQIEVYRIQPAMGKMKPHDSVKIKPGSGPRHMTFLPSGKNAYLLNELSSTITVLSYDPAKGKLEEIETVSTLPKDHAGNNSTAEIFAHPSGKYVYSSNRGHDSIAVFKVDAASGKLSLIEHESTQGKTPRGFGIDPTGQYLLAANQNSDTVVVFKINQDDGTLEPTGQKIEVPIPVCVVFQNP